MLLRKLELYGFKSFADRTEIEFGAGITAIVGPNGSGKSNITDAIRWVLGEQNIRNLRGAKAEDIIFAGSAKRRPLGVAEVSLVFDNSDGKLPIEFNEVTITRRIFRSGESEYFINKSPCRLKDIHELLFDTGMGRDSMTVIGQNKIDEVLNAKPEERRAIFEEAAGITKYKYRKKEAQRKLEDTEQNLVRVNDLIAEIETQLAPLAESAERTRRYNALSAELRSCQVTLLVSKLEKTEKMVESAAFEQAALKEQDLALSTKLNLAETDKERLTDELNELADKQAKIEQAINAAVTDIERIEGKIAVLGERIEQNTRSDERIKKEIDTVKQTSERLIAKIAETKAGIEHKLKQAKTIKNVHEHQIALYQALTDQIRQSELNIEKAKEKSFDSIKQLVDARNYLRTVQRDLQQLDAQQNNRQAEYLNYERQLAQAEEHGKSLLAEQEAAKRWLTQTTDELTVLENQKHHLEQQLQHVVVREQKTINSYNETRSRLSVLTGMQQEYEGFTKGIKSLLKSNFPWRKHIHGAVAEVINVPPEYITAVEIALGGALQYIITSDEATAKEAIAFLKKHNLGRATFLPLTTVKPAAPRSSDLAAAQAAGAIGLASQLIKCKDCYGPIVEFLLGRTIIVKDIDSALKIAKAHAFSVRLVTLDGQQVNPGGSLTGGSTGRRETSILGRGAEIEALQKQLSQLESLLQHEQGESSALRSQLSAINQVILNKQRTYQENQVRQAELAAFLQKSQTDIERLKLAIKTIQAELAAGDEERSRLAGRLKVLAKQVAELEENDSQQKDRTAGLQADLKRLQQTREELQATQTETKIQLAALEQDIAAANEYCRQYDQDKGALDERLANLLAEQQQVRQQLLAAEQEISQLTKEREQKLTDKIKQQENRQHILTAKINLLAQMQQHDKEIKELRRKYQDLQSRLHEMDMLAAKYSYEAEHNRTELSERYNLSLEEARQICLSESTEALVKKIRVLETELITLGAVNPAAIEEYERLQERYNFFTTQSQDLIAAKQYLTSIIQDIDATMSKQFKAAFTAINGYFGQIFTRLFGGGKAEIIMQHPEDVLGSGIDIIAQPPGKKLQNLSLLSGGERSLTVIALLYAFLSYRPAPFCVVDEIDAALDEANVQRFSEFLRDYTEQTQFIVVTHRKGTMELADIMQGVTMEESGVSRLISVKFMDKAG